MSSSPPSTIFFLRHGARLDQINPEWRLTSPTPYDPPLTAKGISQARQTGLAIKQSLLPSSSRRRIIIHTSPFLRCIQTALTLASSLEDKVLLRIDTWLGEWLTPDYYMDINPPPPGRQLTSSALGALAGRRLEGSVAVDWMWDSLKLGDGGEYGEEWGSMHERFVRGLSQLLQFYCQQDMNGDETVVILVTHGAGCNALLGALTKKPVLTDIPISSLSMAVLRPSTPSSINSTSPQFEYDLLLQAETQHLSSSSPAISSNTSSSSLPSRSREASPPPLRSPIISDKRVLEYHPVRSRTSSYPTMVAHSGYSNSVYRHPSLKLRPSSGLFGGSSNGDSPRIGLWTQTSSSTAVSDEEEEDEDEFLSVELGARRKRAVGLWKSWAGEQDRTADMGGSGGGERRVREA